MRAPGPAPRPCNSCPYRRDVPAGVWDTEEYEKLPPFDDPTTPQFSAFFCHQQDGRLCAGWVGCHDMEEALGLRLLAMNGSVDEELYYEIIDYETDVPLFASGAEAAAHGLSGVERPDRRARATVERLRRKMPPDGVPGSDPPWGTPGHPGVGPQR